MKELQEIINAKIAEMCDSGSLQSLVETSVERAVNKAMEDQFCSYNGLGKKLERALQDKLQIDTREIDIPTYNEIITASINKKVNEYWESNAAQKLMSAMDSIFKPMPESMDIQEFCEKIIAFWKSDDPCGCHEDMDDSATVELTKGSSSYSGYDLKIWKKLEGSMYGGGNSRPDVHIYILKDGKIGLSHTWNPSFLHEEEEFVVKAYASSVTLTGLDSADTDNWDLELKPEHY